MPAGNPTILKEKMNKWLDSQEEAEVEKEIQRKSMWVFFLNCFICYNISS